MEITEGYFAEHNSSITTGIAPPPSPIYIRYKLLTLKNPSNTCSDEDLLRVEYHMRGLIGYSKVLHQWFESGKQNQKHLHLIIEKSQMPSKEKLGKISSSFKRTIIKYLEFVQSNPSPDAKLMSLVQKLPLKAYLWHLNEFQSDLHFQYVRNDYRKKENKTFRSCTSPQFIDD